MNWNIIIEYIKKISTLNLNVQGAVSMIATDGLVAYLIFKRIRGYGYKLKMAIIMAILVAIIVVMSVVIMFGIKL